jgi:D-alanyl-D-alanine carboxypeptidase
MAFRCGYDGFVIQRVNILFPEAGRRAASREGLEHMTTKTRHAAQPRRKTGIRNLIMALILGTLIVLIFIEMRAVSESMSRPEQKNDQRNALSADDEYIVMDMDSGDLASGSLVLINREHPYPFPNNSRYVSIYEHKKDCYFVRDKNVLVDKSIMEQLNGMMKSFSDETGLCDVNIVAGHRTYEAQQELYNESLETNGPEHTALYVAQPGSSEHHTGLAIDYSIYHSTTGNSAEFNGSGGYGWFFENAWAYGFVQRYQEVKSDITKVADEPWHFRYVGVPHAYYMQQNSLCLEEYVDLLRDYPYDGEHLVIDTGEQKYDVYYCEGMQIHVPEDGEYTVSGNNIDGFIVTVSID